MGIPPKPIRESIASRDLGRAIDRLRRLDPDERAYLRSALEKYTGRAHVTKQEFDIALSKALYGSKTPELRRVVLRFKLLKDELFR